MTVTRPPLLPELPSLPETVRGVLCGLGQLPEVHALRLGGSRARGTPTGPDSDWDLLAYVERTPHVDALRGTLPPLDGFDYHLASDGHPLQEAELSLPTSPRIDVCFRPLGNVLEERRRARAGVFTVHAAPKHPIGVPSYILLTELALSVAASGDLAAPPCPAELVSAGVPWWRGRAACCLLLATDHVAAGEPIDALGHVLAAVTSLAHARLLALGAWYPITKRLLTEPGAVANPVRRTLLELSPAGMTADTVRRVTAELGLDERTGLAWLADGDHLGPGGGHR